MRFNQRVNIIEGDISLRDGSLKLNLEVLESTLIITNREKNIQMHYSFSKRSDSHYLIFAIFLKLLDQSKRDEDICENLANLGITEREREYLINKIENNFVRLGSQ